jgi:hypothetical protein
VLTAKGLITMYNKGSLNFFYVIVQSGLPPTLTSADLQLQVLATREAAMPVHVCCPSQCDCQCDVLNSVPCTSSHSTASLSSVYTAPWMAHRT